MPKPTPEETIKTIRARFEKGDRVSDIARDLGIGYSTAYGYTRKSEDGEYITPTKFMEKAAEKAGYSSVHKYIEKSITDKGHNITSYQKELDKKRAKRPENRALSDFLKARLNEPGKNKHWLASQLGVSWSAIHKYYKGTTLPKEETLERLFEVFNVPYRTIEDLMEAQASD